MPVNGFATKKETQNKDLTQAHIALGQRAFNIHDNKKVPFYLLNNILGGQSMNSRLNLTLREKHGMVYGVESHFQPFTDSGMFAIFYATEPKNVDKSLALLHKEFQKLKELNLGSKQLQTAKDQIKGHLAMSEENNQNFMLMMAKSLLDYGKIDELSTMFEKIDRVQAKQLKDLANEMLDLDQMCMLIYKP
jgi:predicted Zn-dependent peptidase